MIEIESPKEWEQAMRDSKKKPIAIYKHSNTCSISEEVHKALEEADKEDTLGCPVYKITQQTQKELSSKIASDLRVEHQTPQVIVLKKGVAVFTAAEETIDPAAVSLACKMQ